MDDLPGKELEAEEKADVYQDAFVAGTDGSSKETEAGNNKNGKNKDS